MVAWAWSSKLGGFGGFLGIVFGSFFVVVFIITICATLFYCIHRRYRKRRRGAYSRIPNSNDNGSMVTSVDLQQVEGTETVFERMQRETNEQEQQRREFALLSCQFYLRSYPEYVLDHQLPDIGSRMSKNWFCVRQIRSSNHTLLTMVPLSSQCRLDLQEDKIVLKRLCKSLDHMYVHKLLDIDYISDRNLVVIMEPLHNRGSLKDLVYQTTPNLSWSTKYSVRRNGLKAKQVRTFGRQILHGVLFLQNLGFKPLGQIQSGNIYLEAGIVKLSGYENFLLGCKPRINRFVKDYGDHIDSIMFGHLIFELSSGRELSTPEPSERDLILIKSEEVKELLKFIFSSRRNAIPTIEEIQQHKFFFEENSAALDLWSCTGVRLDEGMKSVIAKVKAGKARKGGKNKQKSHATRYPIYQSSKSSTLTSIAQSPNTTKENMQRQTIPKTQVKPLKTVDESNTPPPPKNKTALFSEIHTGTALRRTITNDRSAPMLH